jgi:pimeloyl-ACP methyl ester carboxylesterase
METMRRTLAFFAVVLLLAASGVQAGDAKHDFFTASDGVKIHYLTLGNKGSWVVLIHGYTDNAERMFFKTGIADALAKNHRVVAIDNRNHGQSDKPEPRGLGRAEDTIELMDYLKIQRAHIHGYSMGGGFTARLMASNPERFITATFGGSGIGETDDKLRAAAAALDPNRKSRKRPPLIICARAARRALKPPHKLLVLQLLPRARRSTSISKRFSFRCSPSMASTIGRIPRRSVYGASWAISKM